MTAMSRELAPSVAAKVANILKHLNRRHADTVLFLARRAARVSDAVDAELIAVDREGVTMAVRQTAGSTTARLPFTAAIDSVPDLRFQLRHLLGKARADAPSEPLTSLEEEIASGDGKARRAHEG